MAGGLFFTECIGFYDHQDAELVCSDGQTIPVHGVIIQQHSTSLSKAITAKKREFDARTYKPGEVVKLGVHGDGQTVHRVISFIYTSTYRDEDSKLSFKITTPPPESLLINLTDDAPVPTFEDGSIESLQFGFQNLEISPKDFKSPIFSKAWSNAKVFRVASEWGVERLVVESFNRFGAFIHGSSDQDGFKEFVRAIYSSFPDNELCDCIAEECANNVDFVVEHLGDLLKDKGLLSYKILLKVVKQTAVLSGQALQLLPAAQDQINVLNAKVTMLEAALARASARSNNPPLRLLPVQATQTNSHIDSRPELISLQRQVDKLKAQLDKKSEDAEWKASLLTEGDLEMAKLRKDVQRLTNDRDGLRVANAALQKDVRDSGAGNERLSREVKTLEEENRKKESQNNDAKSATQQGDARIQTLHAKFNQAKSTIQERDTRIQDLQATVNQLRANAGQAANSRSRQEDQVLVACQRSQINSILDDQNSAISRLQPSRDTENQRPISATSNTLIDISPVSSPLHKPSSIVNGTSATDAAARNSSGPETFIERLNRQRQGAAGIRSAPIGAPSLATVPAPVPASASAPIRAPAPASAQTVGAPTINGARSSTSQGQSPGMQMAPRTSTPANVPDTGTVLAHRAAIAQRDSEIANMGRRIAFLEGQLADMRTGPASTVVTRGPPARPSGGDSRIEPLLRALKEASLEHRACGECLFNFNCQFRGITEDRNIRHLILKCTKCEAEAARWDV